MSEIKSAMLLMIFFVAILFPGILQFGIDSLNQNAFTKNTKEFTELVQEEAGLTSKSKEVKARLETKGYEVKLTDQQGTTVTGTVPYGSTINLAYRYTFKSVFKERVLKSTNTALVTKRDEKTSTGGGKPITPGEDNNSTGRTETKTIILTSDELKSANQTQTFTVDDLGKVKRISSDTGNAEILRINGNQVTVKMTGGATSRQIQTGGEYVEGESKYVTNQTSQVYKDKAGFEGVLNKYVASGYLMQGREKFVTAQYGRFYRDAEGYEGDLAAYLYSGELKSGASKFIPKYQQQYYGDSENFTGILTKKSELVSVSKQVTEKDKVMGTKSYLCQRNKWVYVNAQWWSDSSSKYYRDADGYEGTIYVDDAKSYLYDMNHFKNDTHVYTGPYGKERKVAITTPCTNDTFADGERQEAGVTVRTGTVTKQEEKVWYEGYVKQPDSDTRVYRYQGVVKQPDMDMREWRYQGTVRKAGMDTRTFDKYYQYNLELTYEVKE